MDIHCVIDHAGTIEDFKTAIGEQSDKCNRVAICGMYI